MIARYIKWILFLWLAASAALCQAQERETPSLHFDWDLRSMPVANNKERFGLYSGSSRLKAGLDRGWNIDFVGARKDRGLFILRGSSDVVVQQATIEKEWASQRLQLGMVRLPFGIYDYQETYSSGLIDY